MHIRTSVLSSAIALFAACFMTTQTALAIPANPKPVTITLADGSTVTVRLHGDEKSHYYTTLDNHVLVADEAGALCYAKQSGSRIISTGVMAHDPQFRTDSELQLIGSLTAETAGQIRTLAANMREVGIAPLADGQFTDLFTAYPTLGSPRALVLLVQYPDQSFITENPNEAFTQLMTEKGYSYNGATGSARDYFEDNSRGLFTPEFDVYGPYTLPNEMAYYGRETANLHDANPYEMIADACKLADADVDFSLYDEDGDGMVDNVFVFYAGYGQNSGAAAETIWPHAANIYSYGGIKLVLDGVQVGNYACTNEIQGTSGSVRTGIGTFCHEFSHVLGLPDLYATDGSSSFTPSQFELMDVGSYLNNGNTPPYMGIYDRACLKWINPRELSVGETVVLKSFLDVENESDDEALLITTISENEYYLLENRQKRGWDTYIPGHGMLIWHIDYDAMLWKNNKVNSTTSSQHLRVDIEEADGLADYYTMDGDPFPGVNNVTSFTDNTTPSMRTWTNVRVEKPITNIHEQDGVISFDIMGGGERIAPVEALAATEVTPVSFRINWEGRSEIYNYEIDLFRGDEVIPLQSFTKQTNGLSDCYLDVAGLAPNSPYSYLVRAVSGEKKSANSQRIRVITTPPTFDMLQPAVLAATNISGEYFTANWETMDDAASYQLSVYKKSFNEPTTDLCDFTDGLAALPTGWYTNATATSGMAGTYGSARPSLRLSANNDLLRTPTYDVDVNGIKFWVKAAAATSGTLKVMGLSAGSWVEIASYDAANFISAAATIDINESTTPAMPSGYRSVQLQFVRTAGSLFIDDVELAYNGATVKQYLPNYDGKDVGNVTSYDVFGLERVTNYFYSVGATSTGGLKSLESEEVEVATIAGLDRIESETGVEISIAGKAIVIANRGAEDIDYAIYTIGGIRVAGGSVAAASSATSASLLGGVYIVKVGSEACKIEI